MVNASFFNTLDRETEEILLEIDRTQNQWNFRVKDKMQHRLVRVLDGMEVTMIFTKLKWEALSPPIMPQTINICPNNPQIENIFKSFLNQPDIPYWDENRWVFPSACNHERLSDQYKLRFFDNEQKIKEQLERDELEYKIRKKARATAALVGQSCTIL